MSSSHASFNLLRLFAASLLLWLGVARLASAAPEFLEPEQAFKVAASAVDDRTVELRFTVAPGYYLYREQFKFAAPKAHLGPAALPQGKVKFDETFAKNVETYRDVVRIAIPVTQAEREFQLLVTSQGCADAGICYPPMQSGFKVSLRGFGGNGSTRAMAPSELPPPDLGLAVGSAATTTASGSTDPAAPAAADNGSGDDRSALGSALRDGRFWPVVGVFFVAGVLLSLTPCMLPMLPIVSSIIAGHGHALSRGRGLALASAYSLGMALVYTALGVAAGLAGEGLAAALQRPAVLGAFAIGLVVLSLSMFGLFELRLPSAFTTRMALASGRLRGGRVAGVCAMGGVSALIVSPCVAAPLAGALVYLSHSRDVWLGGAALFSLAAGLSVPLLLVGASAGALLPRAGPWMEEVKRFFGLLLLGVALWTVQTVLPARLAMALWGVLALGAAALFFAPIGWRGLGRPQSPWRVAVALMLVALGGLELAAAARGGTNPLEPLAAWRGTDATYEAPRFARVRDVAELDAALASAGRPVILDFYADWCVSCKEMERFTFTDEAVKQRLTGAVLLKADVTPNSAADRALLKRFGLFGPPGTIFFDANGREVPRTRVIGYQNTRSFLETLRRAGL